MNNLTEKEKLYLKASEQYYLGNEIMDDSAFDELKEQLTKEKSKVVNLVGFMNKDLKFPHPTPMLSLAKYQASKTTKKPPTEDAINWMKDRLVDKQEHFEYTCKYDGNAVNVIYKNGKLHQVLSRGNGTKGRDYTPKFYKRIPTTIPEKNDIIEIRAEVVIPIDVFDKKYSKESKNARNYVAGILNRKNNDPIITEGTVLDELVVMCHEIKHTRGKTSEYISVDKLKEWGFNQKFPLIKFYYHYSEFEDAYKKMKEYRETKSPFLLDGFVIKVAEKYRDKFGENEHDPNWAIAIKFPPKETVTTVLKIQLNYGKTGNITPVAILEPVDLDGSIVQRASIYNFGYIFENEVYPGAIVSIVKSGDIIPQIVNVVSKGDKSKYKVPTHCKYCGTTLEFINEKHLTCTNKHCTNRQFKLFEEGVNLLGMFGIGGSMIKDIWDSGIHSAINILDKNIFNKEKLLKSNLFKEGKTLDKLIKERDKIKKIKLETAIRLMGFEGMGNSTSKQVAKQVAGQSFDFKGLEKDVVNGFAKGEERRKLLDEKLNIIKQFCEIIYPENEDGKIKYELTGSPKSSGISTKGEFQKIIKEKNWLHTKLNEANYLITDDLNSSSSKMLKAAKMQKEGKIEIVTYSQVLELIKK